MGKTSAEAKVRVTRYHAGIHFGICHGPLDYISQIQVNEKEAWAGEQSVQGTITIDELELFGGDKKEGGVRGYVEYLPGGPAQTIPQALAEKAGRTTATMPAYRGIASAWFWYVPGAFSENDNEPGFYWGTNPYLPGTWIKVARASTALAELHARIWRTASISIEGQEASLTWWQKTFEQVTNDEARLGLAFLDVDGAEIELTWSSFERPDSWTERSLVVEAPEGSVAVRVYMEMRRNAGTNNDGYVDDISLTINGVSQTTVNPGAESGDTTGWTNTVGAIRARLSGGPPHTGSYVFDGGVVASSRAYQTIFPAFEFDSNPAHIIYECLTNTSWGMGALSSAIDTASFTGAAATLYAEEFGLSMIWTRQATIENFVSEVLDHIEAVLYVSPRTGLLTLKLIRDDYSITGLPEFTPDNSVVTKFSRKLWGETINEIVVTWTNPANEEEETVVAQDLANIAMQGGIVSDGRNYYGVRSRDLAMRLAQRDLRAASTPLASCDIEVNREGWDLLPGDVCILNSPEDGIDAIVMRVGPVDYGRPGDGTVKASLVEDVWALALADYTVPPDTLAEDTSEPPSPADFSLVFTLPYYLTVNTVAAAILADIAYPEVFAGVLAAEDGFDTREFDLFGEVTDAGGNVTVQDIGTKLIASRATLEDALDAEAETEIVSFGDRTQGNGPSVGGFLLLEGTDETDGELCLVTARTGSPAVWTVSRGVLDTIPREWPAGTPVWFIDASLIFADQTVRSEGETVDYQILPRTSLGRLALADAPVISETLTARPHLPLRPADVTANGNDGFAGVVDLAGVDPIPVAWARRNRLTEDAVVLAWDAGDVSPEAGQTTTVRLTDIEGNIVHEYTGIAGTSQNVDPADFGDISQGYIIVTAVRDSLESLQPYRVHVILSYAFEFEDGDTFEFEDGERKDFEDL